MKFIDLKHGRYAVVDDADYELVSGYKWNCVCGGRAKTCKKYYARAIVKGEGIYMHRLIMNPPKGLVVDHIDGNPLNNLRDNLRICTVSQNTAWGRKKEGASSMFKGVCFDKDDRNWRAYIHKNYKKMSLGRFSSEWRRKRERNEFKTCSHC